MIRARDTRAGGGRRWRAAAAACAVGAGLGFGVAPAQVALRGGARLEAPVTGVGPEGVSVGQSALGPAQVLSWARVRTVEGEYAEAAAAYAGVADRVWRALSRLDRGDVGLAEPALEALFAESLPGPTGADVAASLLRCRLRRGASASAVPVWLACLRLGVGRDAALQRDGVIDPQTLLVPSLPPVFIDSPAVRALASAEQAPAPGSGSSDADILGECFRIAAAHALGAPTQHPLEPGTLRRAERAPALAGDAALGVSLVRAMVEAQAGDQAARARARSELIAGVDKDQGGWQEAWRRAAIGLSLVREADAAERRRGVLELLHLPARFAASQPHLTGVALAVAAQTLAADGDEASAAVIRAELEMERPGHSALLRLASSGDRKGGT